jgi:hypothetical protein
VEMYLLCVDKTTGFMLNRFRKANLQSINEMINAKLCSEPKKSTKLVMQALVFFII